MIAGALQGKGRGPCWEESHKDEAVVGTVAQELLFAHPAFKWTLCKVVVRGGEALLGCMDT